MAKSIEQVSAGNRAANGPFEDLLSSREASDSN